MPIFLIPSIQMLLVILYILYLLQILFAITIIVVFVLNTAAVLLSFILRLDFRIYSHAYGIAYNYDEGHGAGTRLVFNLRNMPLHRLLARILVSILCVAVLMSYFI